MLTPKQELFCQLIVKGMSQADAYREAYNAKNTADKTIWENASRLNANSKVQARLKELREPAQVNWREAMILASQQLVDKIKNGEIDKVIYETIISETGEKKTTRKLGKRPLKVDELIKIFDKVKIEDIENLGGEEKKQIVINL